MAITYGLTAAGFVPKPFTVIKDSLDGKCRAIWGPSVPLADKSLLGGYNNIMAGMFAELWEGQQAVVSSQDPDAATGAQQDAIAAITGTVRAGEKPSKVTETLTGDPGAVINAGNQVKTSSSAVFATTEDAVLVAVDAWVALTAYVVDDRVTNAARVYLCITAGTSDSSGGPTTTADDITDDTVHWRYLGDGTADDDVAAESVDPGPVEATSGDLSTIVTPVSGWTSAINILDAVKGSLVETNEDLRVRREAELSASGKAPKDAIREQLLKSVAAGGPGCTTVTVFLNNTDVTDADGIPPHEVEALAVGGTDQAVFDTLLASVGAGIGYHGNTTGTAVDSEGVSQPIAFTRPTPITIWVDITLTKDAKLYPANGDELVKEAIAAFGALSACGKDAIAVALGAQAFTVPGVLNVPRSGSLGGTLIKTSSGPTSDADIVVALREIATYDTSRITVHSSSATP